MQRRSTRHVEHGMVTGISQCHTFLIAYEKRF